MNRACRASSVFLLTLAIAIPATALPGPKWMDSKDGVLATLWMQLAAVMGVFDRGRAGADPDGTTAAPPAPTTNSDVEEGDSRAGADPNG